MTGFGMETCARLMKERDEARARVKELEDAIRYAIEEMYDTESISVGTDELRRVLMLNQSKKID